MPLVAGEEHRDRGDVLNLDIPLGDVDDEGAVDTFQSIVTIARAVGGNQAPHAEFNYTCSGLSCAFDGSPSYDPDGFVTSWAWAFGDATTGNSQAMYWISL